MKGLIKIIPMFIALIVLSFMGMLFVLANRDSVIINFGAKQTPPMALGLVVMTSMLLGMIVSGLLCSVEVLALFVQNKKLRKMLAQARAAAAPKLERAPVSTPMDAPIEPGQDPEPIRTTGGRFTPL